MNNDVVALVQVVGILAALGMISIGWYLTEQRAHHQKLQRENGQETNFQGDWLYHGVYENLVMHAEAEARKLTNV